MRLWFGRVGDDGSYVPIGRQFQRGPAVVWGSAAEALALRPPPPPLPCIDGTCLVVFSRVADAPHDQWGTRRIKASNGRRKNKKTANQTYCCVSLKTFTYFGHYDITALKIKSGFPKTRTVRKQVRAAVHSPLSSGKV